jgi:non-homologous end joining protein Ku
MTPCALLATIIEQTLPDVFPNRVRATSAALQELLDKKQKGQPIAKMAPRTSAKVVNLMDALRASLESDKSFSKKPKAKPAAARRKAG